MKWERNIGDGKFVRDFLLNFSTGSSTSRIKLYIHSAERDRGWEGGRRRYIDKTKYTHRTLKVHPSMECYWSVMWLCGKAPFKSVVY